jgi:aryl-alcohol dehydrogenase-like predicted oxidoreductase
MREVNLGTGGPKVSAIGLGCMGMSELYGPADRAESLATLHRAVELGVTFLDTSDTYGVGANEELLREFLGQTDRDRLVLATKFGAVRDPVTKAPLAVRGDASYVHEACEGSLRRLGIDHIDLYYPHFPDRDTPVEETVSALADEVKAGRVRHIGLSNVTAQRLRAAHAVHPIAAVQNEWSLFTREAEDEVVGACAELGVAFVPYSPLGRGFLTGAYTSNEGLAPGDFRHGVPRFHGENARRNQALLEPVAEVARRHGATNGQVALAWLVQQGARYGLTVVPIPGTKRRARVEENTAAAELRLTAEELELLEPIGGQVAGDAWPALPPELAKMFGRETRTA